MKPSLAQLRRLVGNPDAYSVQSPEGAWHPKVDKQKKRLPLTDEVLLRHLAEEVTVGTYIGHRQEDGTVARTLVFDVDSGTEALREANDIVVALHELVVPPQYFGVEFSGKKGYHVWLPIQEYRPSHELRRLGRAVLALAEVACEVYPKQDEVKDLGNLVKLPGGKHQVTGKQNNFLGRTPLPMPVTRWEQVLGQLPEEVRARRTASESRFPCMTAIQEEGVSEGGRNIQLFHLAAMLRRAGVSDENVELLVRQTNDRSEPPLEDTELSALLESSTNAGPICGQLPEERKCGELCILARTSGLYTRPGQLRFAAEGENVVVTLSGRRGKVVEFEHDDVGKMKAVLR